MLHNVTKNRKCGKHLGTVNDVGAIRIPVGREIQ